MIKHKKLIIALLIVLIIGTVFAIIADQAVGSCCGATKADIEVWWWVALASEITVLIYVIKRTA